MTKSVALLFDSKVNRQSHMAQLETIVASLIRFYNDHGRDQPRTAMMMIWSRLI